jgi:hypothetical protein
VGSINFKEIAREVRELGVYNVKLKHENIRDIKRHCGQVDFVLLCDLFCNRPYA